MKQENRRLLGQWGESRVAEYLRQRGYRLVASNWHSRFGEIDLIACNRRYLVFVEVKLRRSADYAQAREYVGTQKQHRLLSTALVYLAQHPTKLQPRFDVAEVYAPQGLQTAQPEIHYWENAFQME